MLKTSLTSVTFRGKNIVQVARLAAEAGLDAIEWGGDIHVPPGDTDAARQALRETQARGLEISAYGSYYRAGPGEDFGAVLRAAAALQCRVIRVWAGAKASGVCTPGERQETAACLARAVEQAAREGCTVATEYHANTLTDTLTSAQRLLDEVPGLRTFWQPPVGEAEEENLRALDALGGNIENLHVYQWEPPHDQRPLAEGREIWQAYLRRAAQLKGLHYATLEFVRDGSEEQFFRDAAVLRELIREGK